MLLVQTTVSMLRGYAPASLHQIFDDAAPELGLHAGRLALEVLDAERRGLSYAEAARDPGYVLLPRVHFGLFDFLQSALPAEYLGTLRDMRDAAAIGMFDELRRDLFLAAGVPDQPDSALLRFFFYEGLRLNVLVCFWEYAELEALGVLRASEVEAERVLRERLDDPRIIGERCARPVHVLVADLVSRVDALARNAVAALGPDGLESYRRIVDTFAMARDLSPANALVLRNELASLIDEERLGARRLAALHPHRFRSPNAVDKRRERLIKSWGSEANVEKEGIRVIDFLREEEVSS